MIKFFRHIRHSLILKGQSTRYLKYAIGEIILVVLGILIALQINNWNEKRQNTQKEIIYLNELKSSLEIDLKDELVLAERIYRQRVQDLDSLKAYYNNSASFAKDSLNMYFLNALQQEWDFVFNMAAFENLKSVGIDIISNDSLRSRISKLYSYTYTNIREVNQNFIRYYDMEVNPLLFANVDFRNDPLTAEDLHFLCNDKRVINTVLILRRRYRFLNNRLIVPARKEIESLLGVIRAELEQLGRS